jgi:two-component system OmpR family sensor kinase
MLRVRVERLLGPALVSLLGLGLLLPPLSQLVATGSGPAQRAVAALGSIVALVLVGAGVALARRQFDPRFALRIAGWAVLGTVVLGLVLGLLALAGVAIPPYAAATLLTVSTFAHVLIGVRDVQRIRAEDLARQREKLSVLTRLLRHDLRHQAQQLLFVRSELEGAPDAERRRDLASQVGTVAETMTRLNDRLGRSEDLIRRDSRDDGGEFDLAAHVEAVVGRYRAAHPAADIHVDVPADCRVVGGDDLRQAIEELVDNAVSHTGQRPRVSISAVADGGTTTISVADDGPGIPEPDRSVITRETDITQLTHSRGLGLWFVRWVMDAYRGGFRLDSTDDGTTVRLRVPGARS